MADDDAKKAAENDHKRAESSRYRQRAEEGQSDYNRQQEKLERLKAAARDLDRQIERSSQFQTKVNRFSSSISSSGFKGSLQKKFKENMDKLSADVNSEIQQYQDQQRLLQEKITELEATQSGLYRTIQSLISFADDLIRSLA